VYAHGLQTEYGSYTYPEVVIPSRNDALTEAIRKQYGGHTKDTYELGEPVDFKGEDYVVLQPRMSLILSSKASRQFIADTEAYTAVPAYEGWDAQPIEEIKAERSREAAVIADFIRRELEDVQYGRIPRMHTAEEIADLFGLSHKTANRRIVAGLPKEVRDIRSDIIRKQFLAKAHAMHAA
jgi:hypothetical protein